MAVGVKTAADQLVWAPIMTVVFFSFLKLLEGQPDMARSRSSRQTIHARLHSSTYVQYICTHLLWG